MMRRAVLALAAGATLALGSVSAAGATHTGCEHARTTKAHANVPHRNQGTHTAHHSIPYCPPHDAPRHAS
ncbi:MAG: hypothetical protein M3203_05035 [Actinomycetota bacterium]|nr:hypothetical protein [Actinomycetota bacterium]